MPKPVGKMALGRDNACSEGLSVLPEIDSVMDGSDYYNYKQAGK